MRDRSGSASRTCPRTRVRRTSRPSRVASASTRDVLHQGPEQGHRPGPRGPLQPRSAQFIFAGRANPSCIVSHELPLTEAVGELGVATGGTGPPLRGPLEPALEPEQQQGLEIHPALTARRPPDASAATRAARVAAVGIAGAGHGQLGHGGHLLPAGPGTGVVGGLSSAGSTPTAAATSATGERRPRAAVVLMIDDVDPTTGRSGG